MDLPSLLMAGSLDTLTSYFSVAFLVIFLPVSVVVYAVIPQKARKYFLLIASFAFFWLISGQLIAYLCLIIMGVHYFGLWLDRIQTQKSAALKAVPKEEKKALKKVYLHRSRRVLLFAAVLQSSVVCRRTYDRRSACNQILTVFYNKCKFAVIAFEYSDSV